MEQAAAARRGFAGTLLALGLIVALGGGLRIFVAEQTFPVGLVGDERSYALVALNLASGRGHLHGEMRAHWPPGQSWLLSQAIEAGSASDLLDLRPLIRLQVALGTLLIPLAFGLGRALFDRRTGLVAAGGVALYPTLVAFSHYLWSETLFAVLLTGALWALLRARDTGRWGFAVAAGIGFGLATLTRELAAPVAASCAAWWVLTAEPGRRGAALARACLVGALAILVVAPWTLRNYALFGRLVPVSTIGWMGMREGNTYPAEGWLRGDYDELGEFRRRYYDEKDEMERMDLARREALERIRAEQPSWLGVKLLRNSALLFGPDSKLLAKLRNDAYGLLEPWRARTVMVISVVAYLLALGLGVLGIASARARGRGSFALFVLGPLFLIHVVANANSRYRLPFVPLLMVYASTVVLHPEALRRSLSGLRGAAAFGGLAVLLSLGAIVFVPTAATMWSAERGSERPGRIILFSMDTVRADRVGGFGGGERMPNLRAIAAEGTRFRRFYAASGYTIPSHMSMLTGLAPASHGVNAEVRLAPRIETLAELLTREGYRTQAFHEGGYVSPRFGFGRGFGEYRGHGWIEVAREELPAVLSWMRETAGEPYFLFLHTYTPHYPYGGYQLHRRAHPERRLPGIESIRRLRSSYPPTPEGREAARDVSAELRRTCTLYNQLAPNHMAQLGCGDKHLPADFPQMPHFEADRAALLRAYDARLALVDRAIGRIRDTLVELGQWDDTLLIVTSDHGEAFFEHGHYQHGYVPFDEVLRVPLVVSFPRLLRTGGVRVVRSLAWHLDLAPTILDMAGGQVPGSWRGIDLTPLMLGADAKPRAIFPQVLQPANQEPRDPRRVALRGSLKYIEGDERFGDAQGLLFDLESDPLERSNLREERTREFEELARAAREWEAALPRWAPVDQQTGEPLAPGAPPPRVELSEQEREELRALGYLE